MANDKHVIGVFDDRVKADRCLDKLVNNGFSQAEMSLLVSSEGKGHHFEVTHDQTKVPEGVGYGAVLGALAAGLVAAAIPGSIFVAGPAAALLATGGAGAAAGGLLGGLIGLGIAEDEAKLVEKEVGSGSILVAVHSVGSERATIAENCFKESGAARIH